MKIKIDSVITISEPTKEVKDFIKSELKLTNPEIQKKKAMRILDWKHTKRFKNVF